MDTIEFLRRIIPRKGIKILALPRPAPYKGFLHHQFNTLEDMTESVEEWSSEGRTVFHACASYAEPSVTVRRRDKKTGQMKDVEAVRVADNAAWCRAFWVDLDCGAEKPYATQREACASIYAACTKAGLPLPLLVSSGYGVHCYWTLTQDIEASTWVKVAARLKALLTALTVHQDPTRTADLASILRPVGATNFKNPAHPKPVRLVKDQPDREPADFIRAVVGAVKRYAVDVVDAKPKSALNSELSYEQEYPPSSIYRIAEKCQAIRHFQTVMGDVEEPFWRASLGLIKHTIEGDEAAHEWSAGHVGYDRYETQDKLDRWAAGPATCKTFECFGKCDGCPVKGKITSPIQLGVQLPEQAETVKPRRVAPVGEPAVATDDAGRAESPATQDGGDNAEVPSDGPRRLPKLPAGIAKTYRFNGTVLLTMVLDDDGVPQPTTICRELIYPLEVTRSVGDARQNSQAMLRATRFTPAGIAEEINIPMQAIATGNRDLAAYFGGIGVVIESITHMKNYLSSFINEIRLTADDSLASDRMGWNETDFLLGEKKYTKDGEAKAVLSSAMKEYQSSFSCKGSLQGWIDAIDAAYNRPGQEQYQFMVLCGFAAPLVKFLGDYRGVLVSAVSYSSGQGKTTAQNAAISVYGDPVKLSTAHKRGTINALFERLGAMGTLPFAIDEVSNIEPKELSDLAYAISQGVQKDRLNKSGGLRAQREPWQTLVLTSGNRSLISTLAADGSGREPEMRRIFEINFNNVSDLAKSDADDIFNELSRHHGHAGQFYGKYLARNEAALQAICSKVLRNVNEHFQLAREERFWGVVLASTIAALAITNKLNLLSFDRERLMTWMGRALADLRANVKNSLGDENDLIGSLMADVGFDVTVTESIGDLRFGARPTIITREPKRPPRWAGRLIRDCNELWLRPEYVRMWCAEKRVDYRRIQKMLVELNAIKVYAEGRNINRGIAGAPPTKSRYWELDMAKLGGFEVPEESTEKVVPIRKV